MGLVGIHACEFHMENGWCKPNKSRAKQYVLTFQWGVLFQCFVSLEQDKIACRKYADGGKRGVTRVASYLQQGRVEQESDVRRKQEKGDTLHTCLACFCGKAELIEGVSTSSNSPKRKTTTESATPCAAWDPSTIPACLYFTSIRSKTNRKRKRCFLPSLMRRNIRARSNLKFKYKF